MADTVPVGLAALVDEGLGNSCYLLDLGDGAALVVDPPRDLRAVRTAAAGRYRSVRRRHPPARRFPLRRRAAAHEAGARVLASAAGRRGFAHRGLVDGDEVDLGGLVLVAMATPGTPTSTCHCCCATATGRWGCSRAAR